MAFMLTAAAIALMTGSDLSLPLLMGKQMIIGAAAGLCFGFGVARLLSRNALDGSEARTLFLLSVMLFILRRSYHTWRQWLSGDLSLRDSSRKRAHATKAESGALF